MSLTGGCHCGAIRYEVSGEPKYAALCHCTDCRKSAGAPMVAWAVFAEDRFTLLQGNPRTINSSGDSYRSFCGECGTGLFFRNATMLPNIVDVQSVTLDDPEALPPQVHVQSAERIEWMKRAHELPAFERYPG